MIRSKVVKWALAGALALAAVPAIGRAVGAKHVPTTAAPAKLVQVAQPAIASKTATARHTSHVKPSTRHLTHKNTSTKHSSHRKTSSHPRHKVTHKTVTHHRTTPHHAATRATAKKHSPLS
jgi:hypothetical protein